jgi:hypothetical protein
MTPPRASENDQSSPKRLAKGPVRRARMNDNGDKVPPSEIGAHSIVDAPPTGVGGTTSTQGQQPSSSAADIADALADDAGVVPASTRVCANDLIAELREISGQVNRMMAQVDRAIQRLGVHAGEPVKR